MRLNSVPAEILPGGHLMSEKYPIAHTAFSPSMSGQMAWNRRRNVAGQGFQGNCSAARSCPEFRRRSNFLASGRRLKPRIVINIVSIMGTTSHSVFRPYCRRFRREFPTKRIPWSGRFCCRTEAQLPFELYRRPLLDYYVIDHGYVMLCS